MVITTTTVSWNYNQGSGGVRHRLCEQHRKHNKTCQHCHFPERAQQVNYTFGKQVGSADFLQVFIEQRALHGLGHVRKTPARPVGDAFDQRVLELADCRIAFAVEPDGFAITHRECHAKMEGYGCSHRGPSGDGIGQRPSFRDRRGFSSRGARGLQ